MNSTQPSHDASCPSKLFPPPTHPPARPPAPSNVPVPGRTYAYEEEEDDKHVEDGNDGEGYGRDDLAQRVEAAEQPDDAKGSEDPDEARRLVGHGDGEEGHAHYEGVQP